MTSRDFCFWIQGYFEIGHPGNDGLNAGQVQMIKNHLNLVFKHEIDPSYGGDKQELQNIHDGTPNKPAWDNLIRC